MCSSSINHFIINDMSFIKWLGTNNTVVTVVRQFVGNTLSCNIVTVSDNDTLELKTFVSADRGLVSYDGGLYQQYNKCDEVDKVIEGLIKQYNNW